MNLLGLVFSLLLILSYGFHACWEKQMGSQRLRKTYIGHQKANRKILNRYQSEIYKNLQSKGHAEEAPKPKKEKTKREKKGENPEKLELNRECAKINLWPLIQEGRENHPLLYEITAKLLHTFYPALQKEKRGEYRLLDELLSAAKVAAQKESLFALEKVGLKDPTSHMLYYRMLKGTKQWDLSSRRGYPSLLDYVKAEPTQDKICLFHAHPDLLTALFNEKIAAKLYSEMHKQGGPLLTQELVERTCLEMHQIAPDLELFKLLELGNPNHKEIKKTIIAHDPATHVTLRKNLYLKN